MKKISILAIVIVTLGNSTTHAKLQTLVDNTTVIDVPGNSYAVIESAESHNDANLRITAHGVPFDYQIGEHSLKGLTFTGPTTIQFPGNVSNPSFVTANVALLRKAVGTNIQTLVVSPTNQNSATITVPVNSYAVINSADPQSSATLSITVQGVLFTYALQDVSVKDITFAGPATIQLQGDQYGPSFVTVDVMPMRKSSRTRIETLVVSPTNTISPTLNVSGKNYALIRSVETEDGTLAATVAGTPLSFTDLQDRSGTGNKFVGPATFQLQGNVFTPSFLTVEVGPLPK